MVSLPSGEALGTAVERNSELAGVGDVADVPIAADVPGVASVVGVENVVDAEGAGDAADGVAAEVHAEESWEENWLAR